MDLRERTSTYIHKMSDNTYASSVIKNPLMQQAWVLVSLKHDKYTVIGLQRVKRIKGGRNRDKRDRCGGTST